MRAAILTSSDAGARGERSDESGEKLKEKLQPIAEVAAYRVLPDEPVELEHQVWQWIRQGIDLIVTTGSTGLGPRDVMPEVTRRVIDREVPGMAEAMRAESIKHTPFGMMSRQVVGVAEQTLIINFPGSPKAIDELWPVVLPVISHLVDVVHGRTQHNPPESPESEG
ncbi:MAG: MogA/MoaB family molybdenum cofactor biosynthesis protein [Thermaerobacter sp.]|nr:MogA/MoaB family molybdenum cofactor biosynthesis protein [Thermaerobacter sp.]